MSSQHKKTIYGQHFAVLDFSFFFGREKNRSERFRFRENARLQNIATKTHACKKYRVTILVGNLRVTPETNRGGSRLIFTGSGF
jgi:hypothetical protein